MFTGRPLIILIIHIFVFNCFLVSVNGDPEIMELMFELLMGRIIMSLFNLCFDTMKYVGVGVNYDLQFCTKLVNALKVLLNFCNFLFDGVCVSGKGFVGLVVDLLGNSLPWIEVFGYKVNLQQRWFGGK